MAYSEGVETPPWEQLRLLETQIIEAVPPIDPPACHWLNSDAGTSFCRKHAWEARWKELPTVGPCPEEPDWFERSGLEELMADGIDGCAGLGGLSDTPEHCAVCGCTLEHLLTETGRAEELANFDDNPIDPEDHINGQFTYALTRVFMNLDHPGANSEDLASALKLARDTLAAIKAG